MPKTSPPLKMESSLSSSEHELRGALHEVSNALTVVIGWLNELGDRAVSTPFEEGLGIARRHARLGYRIAREAIGAPVPEAYQVQSVYEVVRDVMRGCSHQAASAQVRLRQENHAADALIHDADAALQILMNLVLNALAFSPARSTVGLGVTRSESMIVFAVWDEGPGVRPEMRAHLFEGGVSRRAGGAGIGLAHCRGLARTLGAELELVPSDKGARFELRWPAGEARSTTVEKIVTLSPLSGLRVVVLEDDPAVVTLLEIGLTAQGVEVLSAETESELECLLHTAGPWDVALVDLSPLGDPLLGIARLEALGVPIVLMSGDSGSSALDNRTTGCVRKPFEITEICDALRRAARRHS